jgi:hypothetical protein
VPTYVTEDAMLIANLVVETLPGKAGVVVERMGQIKGMGAPAAEGDHRVVATWTVPDGETPEALVEVLHALVPEAVEVYPVLSDES